MCSFVKACFPTWVARGWNGVALAPLKEVSGRADNLRPMILGFHVHPKHGNASATEYPAATIIHVMDTVGIDRSVVFAMSTDTRRAIEMAAEAVAELLGV